MYEPRYWLPLLPMLLILQGCGTPLTIHGDFGTLRSHSNAFELSPEQVARSRHEGHVTFDLSKVALSPNRGLYASVYYLRNPPYTASVSLITVYLGDLQLVDDKARLQVPRIQGYVPSAVGMGFWSNKLHHQALVDFMRYEENFSGDPRTTDGVPMDISAEGLQVGFTPSFGSGRYFGYTGRLLVGRPYIKTSGTY